MAAAAVRGAAAATVPESSRFGTELGRQIFVYRKIDTNQIIYSLTRSMRNNAAKKQLTFVGKQSVPAALRKDMWTPLCVVSFPNALQGLSAFNKLLLFKHLHEVDYPLDVVQDPKRPKGALLPKKEKTKVLQDQKANAIADVAHVLAMQGRPPTEGELKQARYRVLAEGAPVLPKGARRSRFSPAGKKQTSEVLEFRGKLEGVSVWWADPGDAEYAETWPAEVLHGPLAVNRYTAIWPPPEEILLGKSFNSTEGPENPESSDQASPPQRSRLSRWFGRREAPPVIANSG